MGTQTRTEKASTAKEQSPTTITVIYPDWAAAFQAYYFSATMPAPPPGYFHSTMALSPQPHPYTRGMQDSHTEQKISFGQGCMESTMAHTVNTTHSQVGSGHAVSGGTATNTSVNQAIAAVPTSVTGKSTAVTGLTINLNIGMEYWTMSAPTPISAICGRHPGAPLTAGPVSSALNMSLIEHPDSLPTELWLQDERELKKQRRKQSNRESARRSRLRKQAECEELAERVETLKAENVVLRTEIYRLEEEHKKLKSVNVSLHDRFWKAQREDRDGMQDGMQEEQEQYIANFKHCEL